MHLCSAFRYRYQATVEPLEFRNFSALLLTQAIDKCSRLSVVVYFFQIKVYLDCSPKLKKSIVNVIILFNYHPPGYRT